MNKKETDYLGNLSFGVATIVILYLLAIKEPKFVSNIFVTISFIVISLIVVFGSFMPFINNKLSHRTDLVKIAIGITVIPFNLLWYIICPCLFFEISLYFTVFISVFFTIYGISQSIDMSIKKGEKKLNTLVNILIGLIGLILNIIATITNI